MTAQEKAEQVSKRTRKHWSQYPTETTMYGNHKYGIGVYRHNKNYKPIEWWLDWESAMPHEKIAYKKYLKKRGIYEREGSL
jgi:hypothetical protein